MDIDILHIFTSNILHTWHVWDLVGVFVSGTFMHNIMCNVAVGCVLAHLYTSVRSGCPSSMSVI